MAGLIGRAYNAFRVLAGSGEAWPRERSEEPPPPSRVWVNSHTAMSVPAANTCVSILAGTLARLPYEVTTRGRIAEPVAEHPVAALLEQPSRAIDPLLFWESMGRELHTHGNAFALIRRTAGGDPLWLELADCASIERREGRLLYTLSLAGDGVMMGAAETVRVGSEDVLHLAGAGYDWRTGLAPSPITFHARSVSGIEISTNDSAVDQIEQSIIAQEGSGTTAALKVYKNVAGTGTQLLQVQFSNGALQVGGTAGSGLLLTGDKADAFAGDTVFSGHLVADAFLALKDHGDGDSTYDDDNADLLDDSWGLLRWSKTDDRWEQSAGVNSSDERVWEAFKMVVAGADKQLQFNDDGAVAGDANLTWNKTLKQLAVAGVDATAAIAVSEGYVQSADGFYTAATEGNAIQAPNGGFTGKTCSATGTAWNALQAANGGVRSGKAFYPKSLSSAPTNPGSGYSGWGHKSGSIWRYYKTGTGAGWKEIDLSAIDGSKNGDFTTLKASSTASNALDMYAFGSGATSGGGIQCRAIAAYQNAGNAIQAPNGGFTGKTCSATGTAWNALQASAGGVRSQKAFYAKSLSSAPTNPGSGYSGWGHKSGSIWRYYKTGTGAGWKEIDLSAIDGSKNGDFTTLKASSTVDNALDMYTSGSGSTSGGGIQCRAIAVFQNAGNAIHAPNGGFTGKTASATDTAVNALQASNGGVQAAKAFYPKSLSSAPTNPGSGYSGWSHKSGSIWRYYKTGTGAGWKEIDLSAIDGSKNGDFTTLKASSTASNALDMYTSGSGATSGGGIQCRAIAAYQNVGNAIQAPNGGFTGKYCSATDTAWNALQASNGGVKSEKAFYPKSLSSAPTNPGSGYGGIAHKTGSTYWFWDGSAWISRDVANI